MSDQAGPWGEELPRPAPEVGASCPVVVAGLDGSDASWGAFAWACGEARRLCGRVVAVLVSPCASVMTAAAVAAAGVPAITEGDVERAAAEHAAAVEEALRCQLVGDDVSVEFVHARGGRAAELLRVCEEHHADVVVVGRTTSLPHRLAGSLARRLVNDRHAPVVIVVP